jgi:hypothetical protein
MNILMMIMLRLIKRLPGILSFNSATVTLTLDRFGNFSSFSIPNNSALANPHSFSPWRSRLPCGHGLETDWAIVFPACVRGG